MSFAKFLAEGPQPTTPNKRLKEGEESYVAAAAYKVNVAKVQEQLETLRRHLEKHQQEFAGTDQQNWAYSGDMARLAKQLSEINEWMNSEVNF